MGKPILCVDFDGVIHSYTSGWRGPAVIPDPPVPGALLWLWKATEWFDVQVYSSRSKSPQGLAAMSRWFEEQCAKEWPDDPETAALVSNCVTFAHEKPAAFLTIGDRAICFDGDWAALDPCALLDFEPWNKQPAVKPLEPA